MDASAPKKVLMIGLDAAEFTLVDRWMNEGALPNLARLRDRGAHGRLKSTAEWLAGSPWPSFYTSTTPDRHGMYHYLIWRPEQMMHTRPAAEWMPLKPFWRDLARAGRRVVALDVPLVYPPEEFPGLEISGWATYELIHPPASHPKDLLGGMEREFGRPRLETESTQLLSAEKLLEVRDQCVQNSVSVGKAAAALMTREPWDLFIACFSGMHRGGHGLWDESNLAGKPTPAQAAELSDALKAVYAATDAEVGRLVEAAGPDATVIVFSLHGMGANVSRSDVMREMLARVLAGPHADGRPAVRPRLSDRLRALVPLSWRAKVKRRLPLSVQDRLTSFWRSGGIDWKQTQAFAPFSDLDGYVRVNLRGRESEGIVEPGEEARTLIDRIAEGLLSFVDADTGERVVGTTVRATDLYPDTETIFRTIPDLMVGWAPSPAAKHRRIVSPIFGAIDWPMPGRHPQGRSGNHRPTGFMIAAGNGIAPGTMVQGAHILDLAPTVYALMSLSVPEHMQGRPIPALAESRIAVH
jgi:predicted AlkP superfamily phosphohydrolase/phosphomutase